MDIFYGDIFKLMGNLWLIVNTTNYIYQYNEFFSQLTTVLISNVVVLCESV